MATNDGRKPVRLGIIGFGDVGYGYTAGLKDEGLTGVVVYSRRAFAGPTSALILERAKNSGAELVKSPAEVAERADLILSVTQGNEAVNAAKAIRDSLGPQHLYVDLASSSPKIKEEVGEVLASTGARLAEGALVTSPISHRHAIVTIASGPGAQEFYDLMTPWGFEIDVVEGALGAASGIKMLRSIVIKGFEALLWECMTASTEYGIRDLMIDWTEHWFNRGFRENFQRLLRTGVIHAKRRAEEAEDCEETLVAVGVKPTMTRATIETLNAIGDYNLREKLGGRVPETVAEALDIVQACFREERARSKTAP